MIEATIDEISVFDSIGGEATVDRLVEAFYARMDALPEAQTIREMHALDLGTIKAVLKRYLGEWLGGPKLYSAQKGQPRLRRRHLGFKIGEAERDAWLLCMAFALEESIENPEARRTVLAELEKLAHWMRNGPGNPHDARSEYA
jgi:hemoglobin